MKYSKQLATTLLELPICLRSVSLNYKSWKKRCKNCTVQEAIVLLKQECDQVDRMFQKWYDQWHSRYRSVICWKTSSVDPCITLQFAQINSTTLYKICKRLEKMLGTTIAMSWLASVRSSHVFAFLGGHHTSHLQLALMSGSELECPLCTNEVSKKNMLIYGCGHNACIDCTLKFAQVKSNGLWYNVLSYARIRRCPYCRYDQALSCVSSID